MINPNLSSDELHLSSFSQLENFKENLLASYPEGLTIYEDKQNVIIEAALPGLSSLDIEVLHNNGYLIIEGKKKEKKTRSDRKYHRIASDFFSYRIKLPSSTNENIEPVTHFKNGIMQVTFSRKARKK